MDKDINDSDLNYSQCLNKSDTEKSFVGIFKSHVSGIINNTPLSKWFTKNGENKSTIRRRDDEQEDEGLFEQPPTKRIKSGDSDSVNYTNNFNEALASTPIINHNLNNKAKTFTNFPEPVAGPSGIKSRKLLSSNATLGSAVRSAYGNSEVLNGNKDSDSEESTSGYSSVARISSKEQVFESRDSSKQASLLENSPSKSRSLFNNKNNTGTMGRSLFAENTSSPRHNSSLSSRRPSFNASTFGSPSFVDNTLSTKRIVNSPFYNGRTIYGGASAYGRHLGRTANGLPSSIRNSVQIKPVNKPSNETNNLVLGKTARRILDTLEQYSSPINDAKKMPLPAKRMRSEGLLTKYTGANPYILRDTSKTFSASNTELQVPDLLKMKASRAKLQKSTESVRQLATSSKSQLNQNNYTLRTGVDNEQSHQLKHKMKNKVSGSLRQKQQADETVQEVFLNPVSLPITKLPEFKLNIPPPQPLSANNLQKQSSPSSSVPPSSAKSPLIKIQQNIVIPAVMKESERKSPVASVSVSSNAEKRQSTEYSFSKPLVLAENMKCLIGINNYKFSEPLSKISKLDSTSSPSLNFKMPENKDPSQLLKIKKNNGENTVCLKTTGSVMDLLGKKSNPYMMDAFKPAPGTWECSACMIRNQPNQMKCIACETPKAKPVQKPSAPVDNFGNQFKMSTDKWECDTCLVRNKSTDDKCVACTTPRPKAKSASSVGSMPSTSSSFGDKFKPSSSTWECATCMIRNKDDLSKCAACETPKPDAKPSLVAPVTSRPPVGSSFGSQFKPPTDTWECSTCMIRNKSETSKCVACETAKPGGLNISSSMQAPPSVPSSFGMKFSKTADEWECDICMVRNKASKNKCECCESLKPGSTKTVSLNLPDSTKPITTFCFGIDKSTANSFSFGIPAGQADSTSSGSSAPASAVFGEAAKKPADATPVSFSFGIPSGAGSTTVTDGPPKPKEEKKEEKPSTPAITSTTEKVSEKPTIPLLKPSEKVPEKVESTIPTFKFGSATASPREAETKKTVNSSNAAELTKSPSFNFKPSPINGDLKTTSANPLTPSAKAFGASPKTTPNTTPVFSFGGAKSTPTPAASSETTPFKFGAGTNNGGNKETAAPPMFGAAKSATPTTTNGFGSLPTFSTLNSTKTPSFRTTANSATENKPFAFGSGEANKPPAFSFSQATAPAVSLAPVAATAKPATFGFGGSATPSAFSFNAPKAEPAPFSAQPAQNLFGGLPVAPMANNSSKNGSAFNFGSSAAAPINNNQKAGFSFGGAPIPSAAPPSGGFNFGPAASASVSSSGGFNFSGAPPTFDATVKPTFNFSECGAPTFSAQPPADGGSAAPRKIKRAVRRTQR